MADVTGTTALTGPPPGLARSLAAAGVRTLYGDPLPGLPTVASPPSIAGLLARSHRAVHHRAAGAVVGDIVYLPGETGAVPEDIDAGDGTLADDLAVRLRAALRGGGARLRLGADSSAPWPAHPSRPPTDLWSEEPPVDAVTAARRPIILAGAGVIFAGQVPGLHTLAAALGCGVLNTWGAKGIFHWRSRHHWATIGLQSRDFELAGLDQTDLVVVTGIDDREAPDSEWRSRPHLVLIPERLAPLAERLVPRPPMNGMPPLRALLAEVTQSAWGSTSVPIPPSSATLAYSRQLAGGGLVAADAGLAGFWVARTFATTDLGMVSVPAERRPGWAAACVTVARLADPLRPALAVIEDGVDETTAAVLDFARTRGVGVGCEMWTPDGECIDAESHERRLSDLITPRPVCAVASLATDASQLEVFEAVAGPIRTWHEPPPDGVSMAVRS